MNGTPTACPPARMGFLCALSPRRRPEQPRRRPVSAQRPHRVPGIASTSPKGARRGWPASRRAGLVLIVDDSLHTRELYTEYLTHSGLGVVSAPEAESGLRLAETLRPDVIVMDVSMPGLNGIEAMHRLRLNRLTRRIPIIVLTGYAFRAIEQGAIEAGADAFLTKPCLPEDLEQRIRDLIPTRGA